MKLYYLIISLLICNSIQCQNVYKKSAMLMGSQFEFTLVANSKSEVDSLFNICINEVRRIEYLISEWIPDTQVSKVNQSAGLYPLKVDKELINLTEKAIYFSEITNGAFDITVNSIDKNWSDNKFIEYDNYKNEYLEAISKINYKNIEIDHNNSTLFLKEKGMKIGFGATGKSYAADKVRSLMQAMGVKAGIINASGDIAVWGNQPNGTPWIIGLQNPKKNNKIIDSYELLNYSVVTSALKTKSNLDEVTKPHIINPKTGVASKGVLSATVFHESAEMANGISTSIVVMGFKNAKKLLKKYPEFQAIIIKECGRIYYSKGFKIKKHKL